jgi:8-oxo-dGTP pyrophosphatase MutT (NUDIX family)
MPDPPEPKPSSTILLVRDASPPGEALEVFMVQRHHQIDFAKGALVFPGGKVETSDADPSLRARCRGVDGLDDGAVALRVAAIRETFEEAGVLLAGPAGSAGLVDGERLREIKQRHRESLGAHSLVIGELVAAEDLELACDRLVPFAHWITPEFMPKRFDTHFFLAAAPEDQLALHDGVESVDSVWTTVDAARAASESGTRTIIFPTLMNLRKLGLSPTVSDALETAANHPVVTVMPCMKTGDDGKPTLLLPPDAGYDPSWASFDTMP